MFWDEMAWYRNAWYVAWGMWHGAWYVLTNVLAQGVCCYRERAIIRKLETHLLSSFLTDSYKTI